MKQLLDAMHDVPAFVQNGRLDILAINRLGQARVLADVRATATPRELRPVRIPRRTRPAFYRDWDDAAQQTVALLRTEAGRAPHDRILSDLVGELSTRSDAFRTLWASHDVREHRTGIKLITHPVVGDIDLAYEAMELSSARELLFIAYTAEPGSASLDALTLLASWSADMTTSPPAEDSRTESLGQ